MSVTGYLTNFNTIEEFKSLDKAAFLKSAGNQIFESIKNKSFLSNPSVLNTFQMISFADLKKFKFYYWLAFPSLQTKWDFSSVPVENDITGDLMKWINAVDLNNKCCFIFDNDDNPELVSNLFSHSASETLTVGFIDSSTQNDLKFSKFLNNYLAMLSYYKFNKIRLRVFKLSLNKFIEINIKNIDNDFTKVTGWERTSQGKLSPKITDLSSLIDPIKLSEQSVDLNLKLMKWRVAPEINLDIIKETKVLLLGSGTLGSYVARTLLGWGVKNITLVDNGSVSYSNPVRQPLFNFEDVGKPKAEAASNALKKIFPLVNSTGVNLEILMAGHPITNEAKQQEDFDKLYKLIQDNDAIFLLTDSRETRWLPTVIGTSLNKIVINAALGFDSYLVMRHGVKGNHLGCYFCNDVVAPTDSLTDRTLDQMCTVTRPGVALLASSLAVELLVTILHHPDKQFAKVTLDSSGGIQESTILGELPHQLRGFLHNFNILKLNSPNYESCSACSTRVIDEFKLSGWEFVKLVLNNPKYLEDVCGLTEVQRKAEEAVEDFEDFSDFDEFEEE